ncbi:unnamed protein product [Fusarium langsethiae]|nr:unnamed protein product [Fusarium langsethiae]
MAATLATALNTGVSELYYKTLTDRYQLDNAPLLISAGCAFLIGYLQYVYAIRLMLRYGDGPIPLWMHMFYLAHDSTFSYTVGSAADRYNNHLYLRGTSIAYGIFSVLEVWCIYYSIRYQRQLQFSPSMGPRSKSLTEVLVYTFFMQTGMYGLVILLAHLMGGPGCIMHWGCLTNFLMIVGPTHEFLRRGTKDGLSVGFSVVNIFCAIFTFAPFSMWALAMPEVFDNAIYYWVGFFLLGYTIWLLSVVASYPASKPNGQINLGKSAKNAH